MMEQPFVGSPSLTAHTVILEYFNIKEQALSNFAFQHCTEVGSAPLINFQKLFSNKVFYILKLVKKFKFHIWMNISGSKSVKKSQKFLKKATNWT